MEVKNGFKNLISIQIKFGFALMAITVATAGCTKPRGLQNKVDPDFYVSKAEFKGKTFHLVRGIEEADSNNDIGAVPGYSEDLGLVTVRIYENEMQFVSAFDANNRAETMPIVAAFPITAQFNVKQDENDFGEKVNKIVEDKKVPWDNRAFMRVDFTKPSNALAHLGGLGDSELKEENIILKEDPKIEAGHISWLVEANFKGNGTMTFVYPFGTEQATSARVTYRVHLIEVKQNDFKPIKYTTKDFSRFGFFTTQQDIADPEKGFRDDTIKTYANVFNVCEAGRAESCSTNKIVWVLTKGFPDLYLQAAQDAVSAWNETFKAALNRTDDVVTLDVNTKVDLSDPTHNVIAYYEPKATGGLLGIAQSVNDPRTGEQVAARATIYEDGIRSTLDEVDTFITLMQQDPSVAASMIGKSPVALPVTAKKDGRAVLNYTRMNEKLLGLNKIKATDFGLNPQQIAKQAFKGFTRDLQQANALQINLMNQHPARFSSTELDNLSSLSGYSKEHPLTFQMPRLVMQDQSTPAASAALHGLNLLSQMGEILKGQKQISMKQASSGVHGAEIVEEATIRYLQQVAGGVSSPKELDAMRPQIKIAVAKQTFYTTLLHEMGHTFGLRHNFQGSADAAHYTPQYYQVKDALKKGNSQYKAEDLDPLAYSSIMDYGADFYSANVGLGPYDKAAIRYAYNRSINRDSDASTKAGFAFCTDHQINEDIRCRQFDKGSTITQITSHEIDRFERNWILRHTRRDRADYNDSVEKYPNRTAQRMINVRQVMDEFIYSLVTSEQVPAANGQCGPKFLRVSVDAGEMANICDPVLAEQGNVNPSDLGTMINGLVDPKTGEFRVNPEDYIPAGAADLVLANVLAQKFFRDILGTPEPGTFLVQQPADKSAPATLVRLDDQGTDADKLKSVAEAQNVSDPAKFVTEQAGFITEVKIGRYAHPLLSTFTKEAGIKRLEILGSFIDKELAIKVLGASSIGVQKYDDASLTGNAYAYPQARKQTVALFQKLIAGSDQISTIPVLMRNGTLVNAAAPASTNNNVQELAAVHAVTDFILGTDHSIVPKLRICSLNDADCVASDGTEKVEYQSASSTNRFRAVQSREGDSIAFALVKDAKNLDDQRQKLKDLNRAATETAKANLAKIDAAGPLVTKIDQAMAKIPALEEPRKKSFADAPESGWTKIKKVMSLLSGTDDVPIASATTFAVQAYSALLEAQAAVDTEIKKPEQAANLDALTQIKTDVDTQVKATVELLNSAISLRRAPAEISSLDRQIADKEMPIELLRSVLKEVGLTQ